MVSVLAKIGGEKLKKIFLAVCLTLLMICQVAYANLKVTMLNVGQGDAILIQTSEQNVLIDTADSSERDALKKELYKAGAYRLDKIILTHAHKDHIGNCAFLISNGVFKVKSIYDNGIASTSKLYQSYINECKKRNVPHIALKAGDVLDLGEGAKFTILYPPSDLVELRNKYRQVKSDPNNEGVVGRLTYGNFSMLFTGDAELVVEKEILPNIEHCTVLKAGHHGSIKSSDIDFIRKVSPEYVFISAGKPMDDYGHPHVQTLKNFLSAGVNKNKIFWTHPNGTVTLDTDGVTWQVSTETQINWFDIYITNFGGI